MENVRAKPATAVWLMISVVLVALNLRPSMAAVGPLLSSIRADVPLSFSTASLLTMLPVMAMGLAMFFGMGAAKRFGEHRSIVLSLVVIGLATVSRLFLDSAAELILSAIAAGIGIAMIQALMPALIKSRFSDNVSLFMGLYVTAIMGGAALAASFSPFVQVHTGSWRIGLAIWAVLAVLALVFWYAQRSVLPPLPQAGTGPQESFFGNRRAWLLALFFGLGTASYTCVLAWLAPYYVELGWSEQNAGLLLGFLTAMEVVSGLVTPAIANRRQDKRGVVAVLLVLIIAGFCGLILSPQHLSLLWPCLLGLGIGGLFPMSLILSLDHLDNPRRAGGLTAFVQGIGYLIAGLSPLIAGMIRDQLGSFEWAWWSLTAVVVVMLLIVLRFDPRHYARHIR
ncbi:CP family cyanate transporter-like MFS transporter [Pseudomonas sp. BIGb0450]|jgi:CP family cyanate transporter-like MFS transporter|uniref:Cyanate transporter n=1 Tax=Pseudomonas yamanorum TaxID=515393 RepID=A0A7Y8EL76_9PSED|nr:MULTISPECIES: cyanate transporter [Pseudomonas]MCS3419618.1 CP family cyanate transporter-like MFS transporter [Pseudomonas sp. BIGb0558]MCS3439186.1 CP family cyanate transporter-like MFS transporter [Pseudomonas sp. BIGb0450]NVZ85248.1 cyanate transporter [Pseudomonas yamanorum]NWE16617.1 cyanate transporter [Pseudomonas yamanorum]